MRWGGESVQKKCSILFRSADENNNTSNTIDIIRRQEEGEGKTIISYNAIKKH
jgi:hypothetical protein